MTDRDDLKNKPIRERLFRQYNEKLDADRPIDPVLDDLLFSPEIDKANTYEMPILRKVKRTEGSNGEERAAEAPDLRPFDNMPPTIPQPDRAVQMGGYDGGFETGFKGEWNPIRFELTLSNLEEVIANENLERMTSLADREFIIMMKGGCVGDTYYRYILEGAGWKVYIHHNPQGEIQPIRVRFGFEALCGRSLFDVHKEFCDWCKDLGLKLDFESEKISRVDMQCLFARPVSDFVRPVACEKVVMRARNGSVHLSSGVATSFEFGSAIRIRCYDKKRELLETQNELGLKMIGEFCCGGVIPDDLARIEFQIRREILDRFCIDTIEDLKSCENSLVDWLTSDWFRIIDKSRNEIKGHHSDRQKPSELWNEVRQAFLTWFPGGDSPRQLTRKDKNLVGLRCTVDDLVRQAAGCFATVIARSKGMISSRKQLLREIMNKVEQYLAEIKEKTAERARRFGVLTGRYPEMDLDSGISDDKEEKRLDPRFAMSETLADRIRTNFDMKVAEE